MTCVRVLVTVVVLGLAPLACANELQVLGKMRLRE